MDSVFRYSVVLLLLVVQSLTDNLHSKHMNNFIQAVESIEAENPELGPLAVVRGLRQAAGVQSPVIERYLGSGLGPELKIKAALNGFITSVIKHTVSALGVEEGVVLTADGTSVALTPLLLGLEAGLQAASSGRVRGLFPLTLTHNLALSFLHNHHTSTPPRLGPGGCWDDVHNPRVFTLSGLASLATDALLTGGLDGVILGSHVAKPRKRPVKSLSSLLKQYYTHQLDGAGLDAAPRLIGQLRRSNFRKLANVPSLKKQLLKSLTVLQKHLKKQKVKKEEVEEMLNEGLKEFVHNYIDCPVIISRCMWEAQPYRGTPTLLTLPLSSLFIHHTYQPSQPCLSFQHCSRDMRAMQRFHQQDRGWDDIGYSFVAGSDGYLYEGRGWHWQGAHTKGHNSKGFGVSFIGNYTSSLPARLSMELVRHQLAKCAVDGGRLVSNFTLYGHRQLVSTSCPGDALYSQIQSWEHFTEVTR